MDRLKRLRTEKGLSQARLAARAELDPSTVNQIERGARGASLETLRKLADALEVSLYELMEEEAPKAAAPTYSGRKSPDEFIQAALEAQEQEGEPTVIAGIAEGDLDRVLEEVAAGKTSPREAREQLRELASR